MTEPPVVNQLNLEQYLTAARDRYDACIESLDIVISRENPVANIRFNHLKLDGNGEPKFGELANCLVDHLAEYCFSARRRGTPHTSVEEGKLHREARALLTRRGESGEAGEVLLYLLCECILEAPQMVAKMELKTNPNDEIKGSDGIHMKWHEEDGALDVYFGESKVWNSLSGALDDAFGSIEKFHSQGLLAHEIGMVTSHFKWSDEPMRQRVLDFVDRSRPPTDFRINHACLIGYGWNQYSDLVGTTVAAMTKDLKTRLEADTTRLRTLIDRRFDVIERKTLRFEVFFLPFRTVQEFRDAFIAAI
ncbi:MAG: DUF1837 domain-containing protein [Proteobacteria bacterium]|nr:DUF1837 domain-containing protein [Pseudomonadota bacterium]